MMKATALFMNFYQIFITIKLIQLSEHCGKRYCRYLEKFRKIGERREHLEAFGNIKEYSRRLFIRGKSYFSNGDALPCQRATRRNRKLTESRRQNPNRYRGLDTKTSLPIVTVYRPYQLDRLLTMSRRQTASGSLLASYCSASKKQAFFLKQTLQFAT